MTEKGTGPASDPEDAPTLDLRGQMALPLGGEEYLLRPSHTAIIAIEKRLGRTCFVLSGQAMRGELNTEELAVIATELMLAEGRHLGKDAPAVYKGAKVERISELIYEEGAPRILARIAIVLLGAATGGYTAKGEARPAGAVAAA